MPFQTWRLIFISIGLFYLTFSTGTQHEGGCDLSLTKPCRSNSSLCVPLEHVDDGIIDCPDGSDEDCGDGWFVCADLSACIEPRFYQDGEPNCHDESDEACEGTQHECLCGFPRCIDISKVGDGILDCVEGSDELAIEKETYICPPDSGSEQEVLRKKRRAFERQAQQNVNNGGITNFYSISPGSSPPLGVLTSTVFSFVNKGTTSEYLTHVKGTSIDGSYAQITSISSRTFFALPTRIKENQVNGLVSSVTRTSVSEGYTQTIVSRIYHTTIDGTYAQLVETETKGVNPSSVNYVTILQGEELHGTFLSHPDQSLATLQFSHLEGSLNPTPVAEEIVTVTGTYGKFIRDGPESEATYSVFTGSYVKDQKTYMFFFGNSALPSQGSIKSEHMEKIQMRQGNDNGKVILDMEKEMKVIMPSELKMKSLASKNDLLVGEGMVDGHKMDGLFIADSKGFDVMGAQIKDGGDIKMLTVTIGKPSTVMLANKEINTKSMEHDKKLPVIENEENNEIDTSLLRGRKANFIGNELIQDLNPTRPLPSGIPTFVIEEPNQNIGDILLREKLKMRDSSAPSIAIENDNVVDNIKAKFNKFDIGEFGLRDSELPTVTYYGFAEFTTTIADTVVVFSPNSQNVISNAIPTSTSNNLQARLTPSDTIKSPNVEPVVTDTSKYSTVSTKVFNTVDLYPSGLVSSIAGTVVNDDMTTLFTTLVYGTYIEGQYAQVVRSTSSIFYIVPRSSTISLSPTLVEESAISKTTSPIDEENNLLGSSKDTKNIKENIFDSILDDIQDENAIARSVHGDSNQNINIIDGNMNDKNTDFTLPNVLEGPTTTTFTLYTTYVEDGTTLVTTNFITSVIPQSFETITKPKTTLTHHTTVMSEGSPVIKSSFDVLSTSVEHVTPSSNLFFNILDPDLPNDSITHDEPLESPLEITTESSSRDMTESPGFSLESSLNPENEVNAIYFPRTYYTTYTYFTTYHRLNTSSIVSSLETITNIITDEKDLEEYKSLAPSIATYPVTYWTTYTYWTTLVKDNSSITTSSKKTVSSVVNLTANDAVTSVSEAILPIQPTEIPSISTSTKDVTTYYTTFTYYTTATIGEKTVVSSRLETSSSVVFGKDSLRTANDEISIEPFGLLFDYPTTEAFSSHTAIIEDPFDTILEESISERENLGDGDFSSNLGIQDVTHTSTADLRTGLLSTLRRSNVIDGTTTLLSTNIYGTFVDGLYVQIQSTTSEIVSKTIVDSITKPTGVVTVNAGSIIEHGATTHYTTQHVVQFVNGKYIEDLLSTTTIEIKSDKQESTSPTKTGRVKEIIGSIIHGTDTTYYHSTVLGTVIGGIYAQKVESTSRHVSGPSISVDILTVSSKEKNQEITTSTPILETSIKETINPTPVVLPTENLELKITDNEGDETGVSKSTHTNRLSFPIRTSKRRTDSFPFIKRTSIFQKQEALSKVLAAPSLTGNDETTTQEPEKTTVKSELSKPLRPFRFGNVDAPNQRPFRFSGKDSEKKTPVRKLEKDKNVAPKPSKNTKPLEDKNIAEKAVAIEEKVEPFKQFRFQDKASATGTRSTLPIPRRARPNPPDTAQNKSNRFRFGALPETTTKVAETTTTASTVSEINKSQRNNPFSFLGGPISEKRKQIRQRKPEKEKPEIINRPSTSESASRKPPRPRTRLGGLLPRRRPITPNIHKDETQLIPVYLYPDGSPVNFNDDDIEFINFTPEDVIGDQIIQRKRRQANFGSRMTSRGSRRIARQRNSKIEENISPSPSDPSKSIEPFTISNPRSLRSRMRGREQDNTPKPPTPRVSNQRLIPSKSRNTLPFRPRRPLSPQTAAPQKVVQKTSPRQSFRRPSSDNRLRISNRFSPQEKEKQTGNKQSHINVNRNRSPVRDPPSGKNPIKSFLARPKPAPTNKPEILTADDGKFEIVDALTVTREVPVTTTIPLIENGLTVEKKVITASLVTETVKPEDITQTEINGVIKLLLSTTISKQKVTQIFIQPFPTTLVTYTTEFIDGVRTSSPFTLPHTYYSIVTATAAANDNDVQDLLKLLLLQQQQQQNPFLAALGLNKPTTQLHTRTFVTTITSLVSTEIPIIFRGKPVITTVVDTNTEVLTTTEVITKTLSAEESNSNPLGNSNSFGGLLPLLLQNQLNRRARDISYSDFSFSNENNFNNKLREERSTDNEEHVKFLLENEFNILPAFNEIEEITNNMPTPPLQLTEKQESAQNEYFLSKGPAEFTPLRRKVRSAQRGNRLRQVQRNRNLGGRKFEETDIENVVIPNGATENLKFNEINALEKPATYYTTFTYYTTYLDDLNREIIQSSEETITQIATFGNIRFDDFTKTNPTGVLNIQQTSIPVQENFTLEDAIIPGMPRPVPDPIFEDPYPPHGPIVNHNNENLSIHKIRKPSVRIRNNLRSRERTTEKVSVSVNNFADETKDSLPSGSNNNEALSQLDSDVQGQKEAPAEEINTDRRRVRIVKITKKRPTEVANTENAGERSTSKSEGLDGVVAIHQVPQVQATTLASPIMGTISTLYTVYSYRYTIYNDEVPASHSTRIITVSNSIEPTIIKIPAIYQTASPTSNLYTLEEGLKTALLEDRIQNGYTTKISINSVTLVNIPSKVLHHSNGDDYVESNLGLEDYMYDDYVETETPVSFNLQSSLQEVKSTLPVNTPTFTRSQIRRPPRIHTRHQSSLKEEISDTLIEVASISEIPRVRSRGTARFSRPVESSILAQTERRQTLSDQRRNRFNFRGREHHKIQTTEPSVTDVIEEIYTEGTTEKLFVTEPTIAEKEKLVKNIGIFDTIFGELTESPELVSPEPELPEPELPEPELPEPKLPEPEITSPTPTSPSTSKSPRLPVRRDDIPIVRRPHKEKEPREFSPHHRLRFNTSTEPGRAVFGSGAFEQLLPSPKPVGIQMSIDGKQNLATKVMDNGVEVIVAEDKTLQRESSRQPVIRPSSIEGAHKPITLPPSTVTNQMLLFASPADKTENGETSENEHDLMFHYKTYYTTLTYYNTILQHGEPVVRTSKETISHLVSAPIYVSGKFVEKTKINLDTSTYLATQTFTKTIGDLLNPEIVTSKEVITQVVVTEVPSVSRISVEITSTFAPVVTRTYFTTYTYYKTYDNGVIQTETIVSSDIVTDTVTDPSLASLPIVSLTKSPNIDSEDTPYKLFATKTFFTTSTYLTTILEGDKTVTSSHIEITSNVVTEPITSIINTDELLQGATAYPVDNTGANEFENINYISLNDNVYKELKTLYATYTHFTTLHNGRIKSNEITKTQLITSTITTTYVPPSLLINPSDILSSQTMTIQPEITGLFVHPNDNVELDPSYIDTLSTKSPTLSQHDFSSESSGLKATVHVEEEGSKSDTFIVQDSTTKATLLVRPTAEEIESSITNVLASSQLSLVETTTSPSFDFDDILSVAIKPTHTESSTDSTVYKGEDKNITSTLDQTDTDSVPTRDNADKPSSDDSEKIKNEETNSESFKPSDQIKPETEGEAPDKEQSGFSLGISPMLTAVAGLIGNTFTGKLAGQTAGTRRKMDHPILPKNVIVAAENEPLFIPVGGVGASLSDTRESTIQPEQGFIPLRHPTLESDFIGIPDKNHNIDSLSPHSPVSMENFGPTFRPPIKTESGFTAITTGINPTKVSVISGEETIFFGGIDPVHLPPPGQPIPNDNSEILVQAQSSPVHLVIDDNNGLQSHLLLPDVESENGLHDEENAEKRPAPQPTLVDLDNTYYYYTDYDNINGDTEPDYVEESTNDYSVLTANEENTTDKIVELESVTPLLINEDSPKTTVVLGSSTILSGATTVYENLFTRPSSSDYESEYFINEHENDDKNLKSVFLEINKSKPSPVQTRNDFSDDELVISSDITSKTQSLLTLVSSVAITNTPAYDISSREIVKQKLKPSSSYPLNSRLQTLTITSSSIITPQFDDSELYRNAFDDSEKPAPKKVNLGYDEENEVNRFINSKSPDQDLSEPKRTTVCNKDCARHEVCKVFRQEQVCLCKPGFSRRTPSDLCKRSESYQVNIMIERLNDNKLAFSPELKNKSHPNTQFLMKEINSGIEKAMMGSELGGKYYSNSILEFGQNNEEKSEPNLMAKIKIDIENEEDKKVLGGSFVPIGKSLSETAVQAALESSLHGTNYSLGGGEVYTGKEPSAVLAATDFDECSFDEHNDCHKNAKCINLVGTFRCECNDGYQDLYPEDDEQRSGRQCVETRTCSSCNYNGKCKSSSEGTTCICNDWFSGEKCEINMKVMLISVISVGAFLLLLFFIFVVFCCCRSKNDKQGGLLRGSSPGKVSTLDRRAMINDTSSESSEDNVRHQTGTIVDDNLPPMPRTPQADYSLGRRSAVSLVSKDRSMRVHTAIPAVLIPRIKTYNNSSNRAYTLERNSNSGNYGNGSSKTKEEALVDVLEGTNSGRPHGPEDVRRSRETILSVHSFNTGQRSRSRSRSRDNLTEDNSYRGQMQGQSYQHPYRVNKDNPKSYSPKSRSGSRPRDLPISPRDHKLSQRDHQVSGYRSRSIDRLDDRDGPHNLPSDVEINSYRYGDRTVSQARSYDETTVRPPIRAMQAESFRSREVSSQVLSEGMPTNAERDGNSTIVYPQMQLYKPLREADSISDLTGHHKSSWE